MKTKSSPAIRISATKEVQEALNRTKKSYPTLSDAEIFKLGLSLLSGQNAFRIALDREGADIDSIAAASVGYDYLNDAEEDAYAAELLKNVPKRSKPRE